MKSGLGQLEMQSGYLIQSNELSARHLNASSR